MSNCSLCSKPIAPGTSAVSIVGGMFPVEDPDFFMVEPGILGESHAHLECLRELVALLVRSRAAKPKGEG